jgi:hypothetical protein
MYRRQRDDSLEEYSEKKVAGMKYDYVANMIVDRPPDVQLKQSRNKQL